MAEDHRDLLCLDLPKAESRRRSRLGLAPRAPTGRSAAREGRWLRAARRARLLSWASLLWMSVEGAGGVISGVNAASISLVAWGLTSAVEGAASAIVIWRFTGSRTHAPTSERTAQKLVAISLFLLAPYIVVASLRDLIGGH